MRPKDCQGDARIRPERPAHTATRRERKVPSDEYTMQSHPTTTDEQFSTASSLGFTIHNQVKEFSDGTTCSCGDSVHNDENIVGPCMFGKYYNRCYVERAQCEAQSRFRQPATTTNAMMTNPTNPHHTHALNSRRHSG